MRSPSGPSARSQRATVACAIFESCRKPSLRDTDFSILRRQRCAELIEIRGWNSLERVSGERIRDGLRKDRSKTPTDLDDAALTHLRQCFVESSGADAADGTHLGEFTFVRHIFSIDRVEKRQILRGPKQLLIRLVTLAEYPFEKLAALEAAERFAFAERLGERAGDTEIAITELGDSFAVNLGYMRKSLLDPFGDELA